MKGRVNEWALEAFKRAEARGREVRGIPAVVEVDPGRADEAASSLRRRGYDVEGVVDDFVFVDLPEPADFEMMPHHAGVRAKTWKGADSWEAEIAIPLEVLGLQSRTADKQTILADFIKVNGFKRFATWSSSWNLFRPENALRHGELVLE